ncbi:MAG: LamG-like jellyroll fold domain-containing protein [Sedimentisphaerales bacterium]|mgnify:CR=1 FL=1|nr:LamG-like jellyroll fold domain-containing protein [Sedimentisphaerales bacterium]HOI35856.1 hypothetical protein [Bacillota bacterium]
MDQVLCVFNNAPHIIAQAQRLWGDTIQCNLLSGGPSSFGVCFDHTSGVELIYLGSLKWVVWMSLWQPAEILRSCCPQIHGSLDHAGVRIVQACCHIRGRGFYERDSSVGGMTCGILNYNQWRMIICKHLVCWVPEVTKRFIFDSEVYEMYSTLSICKRLIHVVSAILALANCFGTVAIAQTPVASGLVFWLDASKMSTLTLEGDKVARWNDLSGNNYYADQATANQQPTYVRGALNGRPVVDFGDSVHNVDEGAPVRSWMQFRNASGSALNISNVRTVFWVCGMDAGRNGFLLGDDNNYHFHRGWENQIWNSDHAHANIRNGATYLNGEQVDGTQTVLPTDFSIISLVTAGDVEASTLARDRTTERSGGIKLGELLIYDRALSDDERQSVERYLYDKWFVAGLASGLQPDDGAIDIPRETNLSWVAGVFAATHDVYFGTMFDDVNDASRTNPMAVLVSQGQADTTFDPGRLEFGQVYYWRIDEVNAAPDYTVFKGNVWQFTVEPYTYPIRDIVATASSVEEGAGPENTINELGLNASDQHSTEESHMWLSDADGEQPTWIQYEFPEAYKLYEMWIWNYNVPLEQIVGFGFKDVTIEHSVNGVEWAVLGDHEFAQGTGKSTYVHNTVVDLAGVVAKYVRLTANSNWGGLDQYGLSEVRFYYVPVVAREPEPSDGQSDLELDVVLDWRGGREAVAHEVYFSTDREAVETGTALVTTVGESRYEVSALNLGTTYYWRIDEVNEAAVPSAWEGLVWTFSTQEYIVVDDFEAYKGDDNAIYETWVDGYEDDTNGSQVGYLVSPFVEKAIVRGGTQSMPLYYDNSATDYSEATVNIADLSITQAWTESNIKTLSLWFYGDSANAVQQMYVKLNGSKVLYDGDAGDITRIPWQPWNIDLATLGVDLGNVTELSVGFERGGLAGASGMVLFDDIRLYPFERQWITPVEPDTANLMVHYTFDGNFQDSSGNGYDGEALDNVAIDDDPVRGKVARFDGDWDAVDVPSIGTSNEITIAMWVYMEDPSQEFNSCFNGNGWKDGALHFKVERSLVIGHLFGLTKAVGTTVLPAKQWHHLVCTLSTTDTAVWLNGYLEASVAHPADLETAPTVTVGGGALGVWIPDSGMIERELTGKIDDVRIYNRALTQEEIAWLAGRTKPFDKPF